MKKVVMVVVVAVMAMVAAPAVAQAQDRPGGFGIGLGSGTGASGISGKLHTGDIAFQGVLGGWRHFRGWGYRQGAGISVDVLYNMPIFVDEGIIQLGWNLGGGGAIGFGEDRFRRRGFFEARVQGVAGIELLFPDVPIDIVLEWRPSMRVAPTVGVGFFGAGAHVRYYIQ